MLFNKDYLAVIQVLIAIIPLVISLVVLVRTRKSNIETQNMAKEAIDKAEKANDIALGTFNEFPKLKLHTKQKEYLLDELLNNEGIELHMENVGDIMFSGVAVRAYPMNFLIFQEKEPSNSTKKIPPIREFFNINEAITKNSYVQIDIAPLIAEMIGNSYAEFTQPEEVYTGKFNLVISAKPLGYDFTVSSGSLTFLLDAKFTPKVIKDYIESNAFKERKEWINVVSYDHENP